MRKTARIAAQAAASEKSVGNQLSHASQVVVPSSAIVSTMQVASAKATCSASSSTMPPFMPPFMQCSDSNDDGQALQSDSWLTVWQFAGIPAFSDMHL